MISRPNMPQRQNLKPEGRQAAPPVYRPSNHHRGVQPKSANNFKVETRSAPPVYRPQSPSIPSQPKMQAPSLQPQPQYELSPPVWIGNGRQQIRVKTKGSPTPIGSVDVHFKEPGKAFISDLEVAQAHRQHGLGSMLVKAALDSARRQGSMATELEANPGAGSISKQGLVSMYQKLGFRNTGFTQRGNPRMAIQGKGAPPVGFRGNTATASMAVETRPAPPAYCPLGTMQPFAGTAMSRTAPPVYRPGMLSPPQRKAIQAEPTSVAQRKALSIATPASHLARMAHQHAMTIQRAALTNEELHFNAMIGLVPTKEMQEAKKKRLKAESDAEVARKEIALRERLKLQKAHAKRVAALAPIVEPEVPELVVGVNEYLEWNMSTLYRNAEQEELAAGREADKPFANWLFNDGPPPLRMNCWESVLFSAFLANVVDKAYIKRAIQNDPHSNMPRFITAILAAPSGKVEGLLGPEQDYDPEQLKGVVIPKGHVVLFGDGTSHVALSSGKLVMAEDEVFYHGIVELDRDTNGVKESTIEESREKGSPYKKRVVWGPFPQLAALG